MLIKIPKKGIFQIPSEALSDSVSPRQTKTFYIYKKKTEYIFHFGRFIFQNHLNIILVFFGGVE